MRTGIVLGVIALLCIIYIGMMALASNGWGYLGYGGFNQGSSFFYFNSTREYVTRPSVRNGSVRSRRSGGFSGGK